ncbi:MAG: protein-glutamate O-methyltransferase [Sneathiella sp.]|nr:protein-glutamate O-methyltransferase [Sneathiella sp.]
MTQQASISAKAREFSLSEAEFKKLTGLVYSLTGIVLGDHKRDMVYGRLARRLRELGMQSFSQYCDLLDSNKSGQETGFLVNAITTNLTKFYRESHHFEALIMQTQKIAQDPVRKQSKELLIWSAGCSSGEEPYSMATTLMSAVPALHSWKVKILATDLDTNMLNKGKQGIYNADVFKDMQQPFAKYLKDSCKQVGDKIQMNERAKSLIHFKHLNLLHQWPMKKQFDVIFCRNVLIYFDQQTKEGLVDRYTNQLREGGLLCLGHSESLQNKPADLQLMGKTTYVKTGGGHA